MGRLIPRFLLMFVTAVASLYAVALLGGALLASFGLPPWPSSPVSFIVSLLVSRYVWTHSATPPDGLAASTIMGAFIVGAIGFSLGFFGPMVLTPRANQGPLLGLFITGPAGGVLGAIAGALYWSYRRRTESISTLPRV